MITQSHAGKLQLYIKTRKGFEPILSVLFTRYGTSKLYFDVTRPPGFVGIGASIVASISRLLSNFLSTTKSGVAVSVDTAECAIAELLEVNQSFRGPLAVLGFVSCSMMTPSQTTDTDCRRASLHYTTA